MANLSFKEFLAIEEKERPSTLFAALRTLGVEPEDVPDVVKGGIGYTPISQFVVQDPSSLNSKLNISNAVAFLDVLPNKKNSKLTIIQDPVTRGIYLNKTKDKPAQDIFKPKLLKFLLGAKDTDKIFSYGNGNPAFQQGQAGGAAPPSGGLGGGGMLA
jgi:hypothetical protein